MTMHHSPEEMLRQRGAIEENYAPDDVVPAVGSPRRDAAAPASQNPRGDTLTQDEIARLFASRHEGQLRYCHLSGMWFEWTDSHWRRDDKRHAFELVRRVCWDASEGAENRMPREVRRAPFVSGVERFAQADPDLAVAIDAWDQDHYRLGTPDGTVDLRTGRLGTAEPGDGITKLTAVAPAATPSCPRWLRFLEETFGGDADLIRLVQQWCGYSLTGDVSEHALLFGSGSGGNRKSVFLNTVVGIMNDYAVTAAMDTFTASKTDRHLTELAMLKGARLVTASETEEGRRWAEARIKQLTGGDPITARFMRQDNFTFHPTSKLTVIGNHQPMLRNVDEAVRRRLKILPFEHKPARPDRQLEEKLKGEWPGILRWMIEGCLDWQANGLIQTESVAVATNEYFAEQDLTAQWLADCCDVEPGNTAKWATTAELFGSWTCYAKAAGEEPGTTKSFGPTLKRHGIQPYRTKFARGFQGIRLRNRSADRGDTPGVTGDAW